MLVALEHGSSDENVDYERYPAHNSKPWIRVEVACLLITPKPYPHYHAVW